MDLTNLYYCMVVMGIPLKYNENSNIPSYTLDK